MEETLKTGKAKLSSTTAVNFDDAQFVVNVRILTELCVTGMNDLATKVGDAIVRRRGTRRCAGSGL